MKRVCVLLLVMLLGTGSAAFADYIGLYADAEAMMCTIVDAEPGLLTFYVVANVTGATGVEFSAPQPACMVGATHVGDAPVYDVTVGDSQNGAAVAFGVCYNLQIHVFTIYYFGAGLSTTCCMYPLLGNMGNPVGPRLADCGYPFATLHPLPGVPIFVNPDATCGCTVPTETSTWGQIKAMYE